MKFVRHSRFPTNKYAIILGFIINISGYLAGASYIINDIITEISEGEVDDANFIDPDLSLMQEMSDQFEYYLERDNLPLNEGRGLLSRKLKNREIGG